MMWGPTACYRQSIGKGKGFSGTKVVLNAMGRAPRVRSETYRALYKASDDDQRWPLYSLELPIWIL